MQDDLLTGQNLTHSLFAPLGHPHIPDVELTRASHSGVSHHAMEEKSAFIAAMP